MDSGNTAWMLTSTALVLFMTPGLAFFYAGMVRSRHALAMLMQNYAAMGLIGVLWVLVGFTLAFGDGGNAGVIGNLDFVGMKDMAVDYLGPDFFALTIPFVLFACYQMTFAIITPALITGATADRLKFGGYLTFIGAWLLLVYAPVAHWVFAGGWLANLGALDFAGGAVVHINAGAAALGVVLVIGARRGLRPRADAAPLAPPDRARYRHPVVRVVRVQRRLGPGRQRARLPGAAQHVRRRLGRHARLDPDRAGAGRQGHDPRRRLRGGRRPGRHHPLRRLRRVR